MNRRTRPNELIWLHCRTKRLNTRWIVSVSMPMPSNENIEIPLLNVIAKAGGSLASGEAVEKVTDFFPDLTQEERASTLDSGGNRWTNRVRWTRQHLFELGELSSPARGIWAITDSGRHRLEGEWESWKPRYTLSLEGAAETGKDLGGEDLEGDPRERLEKARRFLLKTVKQEVLARARGLSPSNFERLIKRLLEGIGYSNVVVTGRTGDEGIDGTCSTDRLGLIRVSFQAKRWQRSVPSKELRDFVGALYSRRIPQGVFVTTSDFTRGAREAAEKAGNITLIKGLGLAELMIEAGLGVRKASLDVPKLDEDFFEGLV